MWVPAIAPVPRAAREAQRWEGGCCDTSSLSPVRVSVAEEHLPSVRFPEPAENPAPLQTDALREAGGVSKANTRNLLNYICSELTWVAWALSNI